MDGKLDVAMEMLDEAAARADDIDVLFSIRNAQQLLQYEMEDRQCGSNRR